jgi:hypothetical protein
VLPRVFPAVLVSGSDVEQTKTREESGMELNENKLAG